ncbi:MAG: DUF2892 domain-containing protein [Candidatus Zixiibacteriota bacterium]
MRTNMGKTDRTIRIIIGIVVLALGYYFGTWWGLVGLVPLLTAFSGWCPAYTLIGVSTCSAKEKTASQ